MCSLTTLPWSLALGWWSYYAWHQYDRTWCGRLAWVKWEWTPNPKLSIMFLSLSILMRFNFRDCVFFLFGFIIYIFWPETKQWIAWGGGDSNPFNVFGFNSSIIACICSRKWSHADTQHKFMLNSCIYFNKFIYIDGLLFNGYKNLWN